MGYRVRVWVYGCMGVWVRVRVTPGKPEMKKAWKLASGPHL